MYVAVEEVLGVVDDFFAVIFEISDCFGDDGEVFVFGDAECAENMKVPALAEDGDAGGACIDEFAHVAIDLD
jgi:hypothetical protein